MFVTETVEEEVQVPFVMVHLSTAVVPAGTPVTVVVGEAGVVMVAVPLTRDHAPVPGAGLLAAIVNELVLQSVWFGPATDTTRTSFVHDTVAEEVQLTLVTVQRSTAVVPAGTPVTV